MSLFSFIILFLIVLFFVLQNGLYLDNLHISNFYLKNSYIRFDNQLHITIDDIKIEPQATSSKKPSFKEINSYLRLISEIIPYIGTLTISKIEIDDFTADFDYSSKQKGLLHFHYKNLVNCTAILFTQNSNLAIHIQELNSSKYKTSINGNILINTTTLKQYAKLNILLNNDANVTLYTISDKNHLLYTIKSHNKIHNIKALLNLIPFTKTIKYWANDAIKAKYVTIKKINGVINFHNLKNAYKHIYLDAVVHSLKYRYNPKLAVIYSKQTELKFKNGILYIEPRQAYTYNTYLKNSWLKINFTKKHELLDLYLHLNGKVNSSILHLLSVYKIILPLKQNSGFIKTDLHLNIDLRTIHINVDGDFSLKKANINFIGLNLNLFNSHIHLHNSDVTIDKMHVKYQNILDTNLTATYNVSKELGNIHFKVNNIQYKGLHLDMPSSKLHILYHLSKNKNFLRINKSQWEYKHQKIFLNAFSIPYDPKGTSIELPPVIVSAKNLAKAFVSATINIKTKQLTFDIDLFKLNYESLKLEQTDIHLKAKYNSKFTLNSENDIYISMNGSQYKIKKFQIIFSDNNVKLEPTSIEIGKYISTKIYAKYLFNSNQIDIGLNNFILKSPRTQRIFYKNKKIQLQAFFSDKNITVKSPQIHAIFFSNKEKWKLKLFSLDKIAKNSDILKKLHISNGTVSFYKKSMQLNTKFQAKITYPYSILMDNNKQIHTYKIIGKITKDKKIYMNVNNKVKIKIDDKVKIDAKNCGININQIIKLIKTIKATQINTKSSAPMPKIYLNALNSYIYISKNRYVLSNTITMQDINNIITAQLTYKKGNAGFKLAHNKFYLYGKNFNDKFMEQLLAFSKFKGGRLNFSMQGNFDDYSGVFFVNNTTIVEYKLLNNILAFVNTIPSLVTFSLPDYNTVGLYTKNAYLKFSSKNGLMDISDFYLNSKELKIVGKGTVNMKQNKINLLLDLKTDLASDISKIPLVGYIVFDGKSLSTTLKVTGKLNNPKIQTQLVKDIVVAPLNIIKRTLTLPYHLIKKAVNDINISK